LSSYTKPKLEDCKEEEDVLKLQDNSLVIQLNVALAQLHQQQGPFKSMVLSAVKGSKEQQKTKD